MSIQTLNKNTHACGNDPLFLSTCLTTEALLLRHCLPVFFLIFARFRARLSAGQQTTSLWLWCVAMLPAGILHAGSLAWPGHGQAVWWLQILSLSVLCLALQRTWAVGQPSRHGFWLGAGFALAWLVGTFWWLFISMHTYGGLPAPLAVCAVLALSAFLGSYYALACWGWLRLRPRNGLGAVFSFAAVWTLAELARGLLWTGFPWGASGYAHVDGPLAVWPRWIGVYGTGFIAAAIAMTLAIVWAQASRQVGLLRQLLKSSVWHHWLVMAGGLMLWCIAAWLPNGHDRVQRQPVAVALLQGNIPQDEKFVPGQGITLALQWYAEQLLMPFDGLMVAPETALPLLPQQLPSGYWAALERDFSQSMTKAALIGIPLGDEMQGYTNSVMGLQQAASGAPHHATVARYRYDKYHLVPFGEFIPPLFQWFVRMMNIPLGDFRRGGVTQPSMQWAGERWAPNICYEDLFGEELAIRFTDADTAPTVLVNISNIAWFGDSLAIDQHLHISRMRALELERPVVRATNTGATAVIDHRGRVNAQLPHVTRGVLYAHVQGRDGITPYAWWVSRFGLWPLWFACTIVMVMGSRSRRTNGNAGRY